MSHVISLQIDQARCQACLPCLAAKACKVKAIVQLDAGDPPYIDSIRCYDCRVCIPACPFEAVRVVGNTPGPV